MPSHRELRATLPPTVPPLRSVRSTLLLAQVDGLRASGFLDEYQKLASPELRALHEGLIAATWVDVASLVEHYATCDRLALTAREQADLGALTFTRAKASLLGTAARVATEVGVTPWTLIDAIPRFWARAHDGSAFGTLRVGPKEAFAAVDGSPLFASPYYRNALRGFTTSFLELFCTRCFVTEVATFASPTSGAMKLQWA